VPFSEIDQACAASEDAFGPFNIEIAVETDGPLDVARLRAAAARAARRHFVCGVRRRSAGAWGRRHAWIPTDAGGVDVSVVRPSCASTAGGRRAERDAFLGEPIHITRTLPFHVLVSRGEQGDRLTLSASHVATDALGALCLLRTIAAEYAGRAPDSAGASYAEARELLAKIAEATPSVRQQRWRAAGRLAREVWPGATTHVAASPGACGTGSGVHHHRLPWTSVPRRNGDAPTVNDVLVVALLRAIEEHNIERGVACGRMTVLVPLNLRPAHWTDEPMGNFSAVALVVSHPRDRVAPRTFLDAVAAQGRRLRDDRAAWGMLGAMGATTAFPLLLQDAITRVGYACEPQTPTAILSNLGRIEHAPDFGGGTDARALWMSPPCRSPCSLGVGVLFHAGQLHFSLRYPRHVLGPADVETIARRMAVEATALARLS
jgi:hypothetical protein